MTIASRNPQSLTSRQWCVLCALLGYGLLLRTVHLSSRPFVVDEAESSINALTILQHGVPRDQYLGVPIFENTLTEPWPESEEFEFRDTSYARGGLAIYHAWLPLYSMAASFSIGGIHPDVQQTGAPHGMHSVAEMHRRTLVARVPAVLFGLVFMLGTFFAAREIFDIDAAWAALSAVAVLLPAVEAGRTARYYSPLLALTTLAAWGIWRMFRRQGLSHAVIAGLIVALLFHTHSLSCLISCAAAAALAPFILWQPRGVARLMAFGAVVALGIFPWALVSGFLSTAARLPTARSVMHFPADLVAWPIHQAPFMLLGGAMIVWQVVLYCSERWRTSRFAEPFVRLRWPLLFMAAWALIAFLAFILFMPAASYFFQRMTLVVLGPGVIFAAGSVGAVAKLFSERRAGLLASVLLVVFFAAFGKVRWWDSGPNPDAPTMYDVAESLGSLKIPEGTKLYATPNDHLIFTIYTGMPVADIAPVRKRFLDRYAGPIMLLEAPAYYNWMTTDAIRKLAEGFGIDVSTEEAERLQDRAQLRLTQMELSGHGATISPAPDPQRETPFMAALIDAQRQETHRALNSCLRSYGAPIFNDFHLDNFADFWQVFFYRFADADARRGENLNYAARIRNSDASVLPLYWVLYDCPPRSPKRQIVTVAPQ